MELFSLRWLLAVHYFLERISSYKLNLVLNTPLILSSNVIRHAYSSIAETKIFRLGLFSRCIHVIFISCFYLIILTGSNSNELWTCSKLSKKKPEQLSKIFSCFFMLKFWRILIITLKSSHRSWSIKTLFLKIS